MIITPGIPPMNGGASIYSNVQGDFTATANNGAKTITLSAYASSVLSGALTTKSFANAVIKKIDTNGVVTTLPLTNISYAANVLTLADLPVNFVTTDTVEVFVPGPDKGFIAATNVNQVAITDGTTQVGIETAGVDAGANTDNTLEVTGRMSGFNGTTWDRIRTGLTAVQTTFVGLLNSLGMGTYNATPLTLLDTNAAPHQMDARGNLKVAINDGANQAAIETAGADAVSNTNNALSTKSRLVGFNGTTWDRIRAGVTTATATLTGFLNTLPWAVYNATAPTKTDGQGNPLQSDSLGNLQSNLYTALSFEDFLNRVGAMQILPLAVSTYSYTRFQNLGANATLNVKATAGNVFSVTCHNTTGADRYFQLHNTATTPAGGAVPLYTFHLPANSSLTVGNDFFGPGGANFSTGIAFAVSTTEGTYTAATATDHNSHVMYV